MLFAVVRGLRMSRIGDTRDHDGAPPAARSMDVPKRPYPLD